ncbi:FtsX-like permease family protein [Chryseolinea sp. T2]|uniref:ABC transporter permease n=1 Tax=Chryseolinea sp. T2 TaxID=3129255 RepID=UPI003076A63A
MLKNYVLIAWRNFVKHRTFTLINVTGFALAMASCFLIIFHINSEISYETFYPDYQNIYRIHPPEWAKSSPPMAQALEDFFPEIKSSARFYPFGSGAILTYNDFRTVVGPSHMADSTALTLFNYQFIEGSEHNSLRVPFTAVLTESLARKIFGEDSAVGKTIKLNDDMELSITGVVKDLPENTHLRFDMLVAFSTFYKIIPDNWTSNRGWMAPFTYLLIEPGKLAQVESKIPQFQVKFYEGWDTSENLGKKAMLELQPIRDIHLHSHLEQETSENSNVSYLYIFAAVALFILFMATVNFINLNLSLTFNRMKETGLRKVMGALRPQLVKQYLSETFLMSSFALVLALCLFFAVLPNYNALAGRKVHITDVLTPGNIAIMAALIIFVSALSGAYPALFMSRFKPVDALRSQKGPGSSTPAIRRGLVVFQFAVSAFMIASTLIIIRQMHYFQDQDLGFNKDKVISVGLYGDFAKTNAKSPDYVRSQLMKDPSIISIGSATNLPGGELSVENVVPEGADPKAEFPQFRVMSIDDGFLQTLEIPIIEGRAFSRAYNDSAAFIVNKTALKALNISNAIGARIVNQTRNMPGIIVGVVDDYHFSSLHNAVEPLLLQYNPKYSNHLLIKTNSNDLQNAISHVESTVKQIAPSNLFSYTFVEDHWNEQYKEENKMNVLFNTFSAFMIVISCVGLFGLSAITMQTRRKEIGIRKIVGATVPSIVNIVSKEFVILVVAGSLIGLPLSWYAMNAWLSKFVYKIDVTADVFVISAMACVVIAVGSVIFNALHAALRNPIESLRSE